MRILSCVVWHEVALNVSLGTHETIVSFKISSSLAYLSSSNSKRCEQEKNECVREFVTAASLFSLPFIHFGAQRYVCEAHAWERKKQLTK